METPKIKLYIPYDIMQDCFSPQDFYGCLPKKIDDDEVPSDSEKLDESDEEK